jgi:XTP/dITP diphosphohydrolase
MPRNSPPGAADSSPRAAHPSGRSSPQRLIVATANAGKLLEFRELLQGLPFRVESLAGLGMPSPEETGRTFLDNALLKARHAQALTRSAVLADDSGLEVDALGGAPGIFSARYAGPGADDAANNAKLIAALDGVPQRRRSARYRCALVFLPAPPDAVPVSAEGVWSGSIVSRPRGSGGFGYDPHFFLPELALTVAELDAADKNRLSHRAQAMRDLRQALAERYA